MRSSLLLVLRASRLISCPSRARCGVPRPRRCFLRRPWRILPRRPTRATRARSSTEALVDPAQARPTLHGRKPKQMRRTGMASKTICINCAPVLTLWAAFVAEQLGFDVDEALTLGKAMAGLTAQSKGRRLGVFKLHEEKPGQARKKERGEEFWIELCGRLIPARNAEDGIRAVHGTQIIRPDS